MLEAHIIKRRRQLTVDVQIELAQGEALGLFGPSGAGKSTVLACIAGFEEPDEGYVRVASRIFFPPSLALHKRGIGYLTQHPGLFPHLLVHENVNFGIAAHLAAQRDHLEWIEQLRGRLQLESIWNAPASRISGGQARRVSLARMLAHRPRLLLLDEPFSGLDRQLVRELIEDLIFWNGVLGCAMIAVDHQAEVLQRLCPKQVMAIEEGAVVQRGSWDDLRRAPATPLLRSLLEPL